MESMADFEISEDAVCAYTRRVMHLIPPPDEKHKRYKVAFSKAIARTARLHRTARVMT